jgi:hypothetical protein
MLPYFGAIMFIKSIGGRKGNSVSVKFPPRSRIKAIKVICDRCKQIAEGIRGEQFTSGFYDMTTWEEYRRENEQHVCHSCMLLILNTWSVTALASSF